MATLDNPSNIPEITEVPVRPTAMKYGGIGGGIAIVLGLIFYLAGMTDPADQGSTGNTIAQLSNYVVWIGAIIMAIKFHKENELGNFLTMGRSIGLGTLTGLILGLMGAIWVIIFFTVIDPGMLETIREVAYEQAIERGTPEDQMDQIEGIMNFFTSPAFFAIFITLAGVVVGLVTGLITGAVLKKDPPVFD